ncbi:hypothetical protein M3Y98_01210700 [Aphelenchoides besseyi]|nr:hypothetical protein M3Y98_01210700 [Aphelenchoides besseyi]KAI6193211.1 hypothetical protein M3Y96_00994400 [Aphelenchoides besseyi]
MFRQPAFLFLVAAVLFVGIQPTEGMRGALIRGGRSIPLTFGGMNEFEDPLRMSLRMSRRDDPLAVDDGVQLCTCRFPNGKSVVIADNERTLDVLRYGKR